MLIKTIKQRKPPTTTATTTQQNCSNMSANAVTTRLTLNTNALLLLGCCLLTLLPTCLHAYNIDLPSYVLHQREPNTMFGFSIAFHKGRNDYPPSNSLIVGAPKFDTSSFQYNVREAGVVFRCKMDDGDCYMVKFDSTSNNNNSDYQVIDRKSYQWLGATVATSRQNDLIVACAPRYVFHTMTPSKMTRYDPVGTCFTSHDFENFREISPCRTNNWGYHRQGSCQAGFSAAANSNGDRLYIGAPGSWYWQGQVYSVSPNAKFPFKPPYHQPFGTGGQTYSYDVTHPENQVYSTTQSSAQDDDSYLGYSMVTGYFDGDNYEDVAIGMPRGAHLLGKIVLRSWNMGNIVNITGHQIGEYFGYAVATSDVDGNGLDDLIIGAPMHSEPGNVEGKYDVGRVYIILQSKTGLGSERWTNDHIRDGFNTKGRFGLSLASLGDVNLDGYGDFAVGAPYDGPEGRGVVYIYHGSENGPLLKPSQIIKAEDIVESRNYPRTFGFSLAGGVDMDGNQYPDLAVGAYASDQVFIFKSRPVVVVDATTHFVDASKLINLDERNCVTRREGKNVPCTEIRSCWSYKGANVPSTLNFDISWVLDAKKPKNPRLFFLRDEDKNIRNQPIQLHFGNTFCLNETVYIDNAHDKLTPLEVEMRYNLRSNRNLAPAIRRKREALEPVIDQDREIIQRDAINIQKNCGLDNICIPDLGLQIINPITNYVLGSNKPLTLEVLVANNKEDAFEAAFYMTMPKDLDYKKIQPIGDKSDTPITCTAPDKSNNHTLKCDLGNPLPGKKVAHFNVIMLPSHKVGMAPSYDFFMVVNSTNAELEGDHINNEYAVSIGIWIQTNLTMRGTSHPDYQLYKASDYKAVENATKEEDLGPQVVHLYDIRNNGPSTIEEAVILIHYPYETEAGDLLMYLTNQPEIDGNIVCDPHLRVNSRNLQLDQNLVRKSYLEQYAAVVRTQDASSLPDSREGGVYIEKSISGATGGTQVVAIGSGTKVYSAEEKKRLEKEDEQDVSGDASLVHSQRANAAAEEAGRSGSNWSWSSSWNSSSDGRGPSVVVSTRNSSVFYDASGQPHVVESSTEYVRNLDRAPNYQEQHFSNYQQGGENRGSGGSYQSGSGNIRANAPIGAVHLQPQQQVIRQDIRGQVQSPSPSGATYQRTYTNYNPGGSSSTAYRAPPQQYNAQRVGSAASYNDFGSNAVGSLDKIAQGGHGFQAGTLDLGTLNRQNVDNEVRNRNVGGRTGNAGNFGYQQTYSSSGTIPPPAQGSASWRQSSSYGSSGKPYYGMEDGDYYDDDKLPQNAQQQAGQWAQTASTAEHRRFRRDDTKSNAEAPLQVDLTSPCTAAKCEKIRCVAKNLGKEDGVFIALRMRMVAKTMEKLASNVPLNTSTMAVAYVTRLPFIGEPKDEIIKSHEIFFKAVPEPTPVPDVVPLWVVVLAACLGALILLLLILCLYRCGFFNRNRPSNHTQERQPLRNGYHGDEHL